LRLLRIVRRCLCALLLLSAPLAHGYEEPAYHIVATIEGIEYRRYEPYLVAETVVVGIAIETAPPTSDSDGWTVSFIVPRMFTSQTVPRPTDPAVYIREVPSELRAVLRYSGRWSERNVSEHVAKLKDKLAQAKVEPVGEVTTAFYNVPFSLPFMRRNEVMVVVGR